MKKSTKVIISLVLCVLSISLFGCGVKSPSDTVKEYLEQVKRGENGDFSSLLNQTLEKGEQNKEQAKEKTKEDESTKKISEDLKKITYTINSEKIDGDNATVNVKIKGPDLATVMGEYIQKSMAIAFSQAFSNQGTSEKDMDKIYENILMECLNNMKFTERTGDISLSKVDGKWKINNNGKLTKLLINIDDSFFHSDKKATNNKKEIKKMELNKPFNVDTEHGKYTVTIEGARFTDKRNEFSEKKANKVVILDYSYANESFGKTSGVDLFVGEDAFQVLDDEGNVLDTYPVYDENRTPKNVPVGGKCKGSITYALPNDSKNLNLTFVRGSDKISNIKVPIK